MSRALLERPAPDRVRMRADACTSVARLADTGRAATLDDVVSETWAGLVAHRRVRCLVCDGSMAPRYGAAGHSPVGGRCGDCGSSLG